MIKSAAIRTRTEILTGNSHSVIIPKIPHEDMHSREFGFVDAQGEFFDRKQAMVHAKASGQVVAGYDEYDELQSYMLKY